MFSIFNLLMLLCAFINCAHSTKNAKKNVLLIIVDDLRPALGCYNDPLAITPNIDRFAKQSVVFQRTYVQQALCAPSRNSMLTSRRPDTLHLYDFYSYWRDSVGNFTTIPQYFKEHGYQTYSIGKVFHPGASSNFTDDYPFSWTRKAFHPSAEKFMNEPVCFDEIAQRLQKNVVCPVFVDLQPEKSLPDIQSVAEAKRILTNDVEGPFFMAVGLHKPHIPLRFPAKYLNYHAIDKFKNINFDYVPNGLPNMAFNPYNDIRKRDDSRHENISFPFGPVPRQFGWRMRQAYYAAVTFVDDLIGDLVNSVNASNTIIVLTSDHGWSLGEHAEWAKYSNYDVAVHVPLIVYSPEHRFQNAKNISEIAELIDVFPTIVDLATLPCINRCGSKAKQTITCAEGKSLISHFSDSDSDSVIFENATAISQYPRPGIYPTSLPDTDQPRLKKIKIMGYSLRMNSFRYTIWIKFLPKSFKRVWSTCYGEELYDHSIDPDEMINLSERSQFASIKLRLKNNLQQKLNETIK